MLTFRFQDPDGYGITPVDNLFIDYYMVHAPGDFVKVYLLALKYCYTGQNKISNAMLASKLDLLESDVVKAWEYWSDNGLVNIIKLPSDKEDNIIIEFIDPKYAVKLKPGTDKLISGIDKPEIKQVFETIEKIVGRPLSPKEMEMYLDWIDEYSMSPEVIIMLVQYCISKNVHSLKYMEAVAQSWHDNGIRTLDDVEAYLKKEEQTYINYKKILRFLGLDDSEIMEVHKEYMSKWLNEMGFDLDVILEACKACTLNINKPNFSYIDKVLTSWAREGIKTIEDYKKRAPQLLKPDKGNNARSAEFQVPKNYFNSYKDQRKYNVAELEKKLLARSRSEEP